MNMWFINLLFWVPVIYAITPLEQAVNDFTYQFSNYRNSYSKFSLTKAQFATEATFARQEELTAAAKNMLLDRDEVWATYFQTLNVDLNQNSGVNEADKQHLNLGLASASGVLEIHKQKLKADSSRDEVLASAGEINNKKSEFYNLAFSALASIRKGRLVMASRDLKVFGERLRQSAETQILDETARVARIRGINEALALLSNSDNALGLKIESLDRYVGSYQPQQLYQESMEGFEPHYRDIVRVYGLLKELSQDIEI